MMQQWCNCMLGQQVILILPDPLPQQVVALLL
jgi:hypothetical protein